MTVAVSRNLEVNDESLDSRTRLLVAASELMTEQGIRSLSFRSIAGRAGLAFTAVTYYFDNKESLIEATFRYQMEMDTRRLRAISEQLSDLSITSAHLLTLLLKELKAESAEIHQSNRVWYELQGSCASGERERLLILQQWNQMKQQHWESLLRGCQVIATEYQRAETARIMVEYSAAEAYYWLSADHSPSALMELAFYEKVSAFIHALVARSEQGDKAFPAFESLVQQSERQFLSHYEADDNAPPARKKIINASLELIAQEGPASLTNRRIAQQAGVSLASTTYHFKALSDLLETVVLEIYQRFGQLSILDGREIQAQSKDELVRQLASFYRNKEQMALITGIENTVLLGTRLDSFQFCLENIFAMRGSSSFRQMQQVPELSQQLSRMKSAIWSTLREGQRRLSVSYGASSREEALLQRHEQVFCLLFPSEAS
ncbi:TetR/AcrR family transcriptional regulator [Endozoicomonas arenosclerae]|uniref:TetR/AcrR family transcriptional regulator n=1 Tax=Endozoicomonas arenosclerae TaxID=1633495 RepID=UPI000784F264|nr:TetR family transcriptional regulator [Endozoicomonas arenosclerae]